jgi:hypothetical protein
METDSFKRREESDRHRLSYVLMASSKEPGRGPMRLQPRWEVWGGWLFKAD